MLGKTHQLIGVTAGLAAYLILSPVEYSPATLGAVLVTSHFAALLPDIDQPASALWRSIPAGRILGEFADSFLEHRNLTHSLLGILLVGWGLSWLLNLSPDYWGIHTGIVYRAGMAAYISHLVADMVTVEGIPLLWPIPRMYGLPPVPFQGLRILTGHWFENLVVFPLVNVVLFYLLWRYFDILKIALFK